MTKSILRLVFISLVLSLTVALTGVAHGAEWAEGQVTLNGFFKNWTGYRLGSYGHERDDGLSIFRNVLQLEAEAKLQENLSLVGIFRAAREPEYSLEDDAREAGNFDGDVMDEEEFRELYLAWQATDNFWAAVGKQQVVWGDLSGIGLRVMDNINALDCRWHYALDNLEDVRKPLIMLNTIYSMPSIEANLQLVWVPGLEDTWHRVTSIYANPGHRYGLNNLVDPTQPPDFFALGVPEDDEADANGISKKLSDSTIGIRFQKTSGGVTWAVSNLYTHNQNPSVWVDADGLHIKYLRQNIFGFTANWYDKYTDGVWLFEAGYFHHAPFTGNDFSLVKQDMYKWGLRYNRNTFFDFLSPTRSLSSGFQIIQTYIPDNDDFDQQNDTGVGGETTDTVGTLFLNWGVANDRVQFNTNFNWWLERKFGIAMLWIDYRPQIFAGNFLITPKLILMHGDTPLSGDFGLMRGATEAVLELTYEF